MTLLRYAHVTLAAVCFLAIQALANAEDDPITQWMKTQAGAAAAGKQKPTQTESISIDHGSTNFVDQSSGTDLLGAALNLVPVNGGGGNQNGSGTVTASLYSIYTLATRQDPLAPTVYNSHAGLRKLFFTIGREQQNTSSSTTTPAGTVYGAKWLLFNRRDATSLIKEAQKDGPVKDALGRLQGILDAHAVRASAAREPLLDILAPDLSQREAQINALNSTGAIDKAVAALSPADRARVDGIIQEYKAQMAKVGDIQEVVDVLASRGQLSLGFQTTQRSGTANSDYRVELIYDQSFSRKVKQGDNTVRTVPTGWSVAANGSWDYSDSPKFGGDTHGGRGALQLKYDITKVSGFSLRSPMHLALSGEGVKTQLAWNYRAQLQLNIPIASGINLPLSFGYGNQADVLRKQESAVYGKFGLTFDFAKIVDTLRGPH